MKCIICDKEIEKSNYLNEILCSSECFYINFWNRIVDDKHDKRSVRENGTHYWIGEETNSSFKGFGGTKFKIQFDDGRVVLTDNLWQNGKIPEDFKEKLPNNCVFITDKDNQLYTITNE